MKWNLYASTFLIEMQKEGERYSIIQLFYKTGSPEEMTPHLYNRKEFSKT